MTVEVVVEMFLLLRIGIGPKIALVPYVETTKDMDKATKAKVTAQDARHGGMMYHEWAFGPRELTWISIGLPEMSKPRSQRSNAATHIWQTTSHR